MSTRTTLTLDDDLLQRLKRESVLSGETFKSYVNAVIRRGLEQASLPTGVAEPLPTYALGTHIGVDLTKALKLAAELDDASHDLLRTANAPTAPKPAQATARKTAHE